MSRIGAVIKKAYAKELEAVSAVSGTVGIEIVKKWNLSAWKVPNVIGYRTIGIAIASLSLIAALLVLSIIHYNRFKDCFTVVCVRKADLEKELRRRENLLPNIARLVEKYSVYEEKMFKYVSAARESLSAPHPPEAASGTLPKIGKEMGKPLAGLVALAEQYPNLKAMQSTQVMIAGLVGSENRIAAAKEKFNNSAEDFNQLLTTFPGNLFAKLFGCKKVAYCGLDTAGIGDK